jgi:cytochrome subunit of sulfide dehydrogenase
MREVLALIAVSWILVSSPAAAQESTVETIMLAGGCATCHGPDGRSPGEIPAIAGVPAEVLEGQLLAFRADEVPGTTVMTRIAKGFSPDELKALAAHFANQTR